MSPLYTAEEREDIERLRKARYSTWLSASQCAFDALFELGHRACIRAWRAKCERKERDGIDACIAKLTSRLALEREVLADMPKDLHQIGTVNAAEVALREVIAIRRAAGGYHG